MPKEKANNIRVGWVIEVKKNKYIVLNTRTVKPGKGGAFMQIEMRGLINGLKNNHSFRTDEIVEKLAIEELRHQYLYKEGGAYIFMNMIDYDQLSLGKEILKGKEIFLEEGIEIEISFINGVPISVLFPKTLVCEITEADPAIKGSTITATGKMATLSNGIKLVVPTFISPGDKIVVNTDSLEYIERSK
ncbi:MAG: elongation factor P [Alphaproteobacteria bacterium]|nr:elongation factor P [Alphaproteobacteria bacterium]MBL0717912.1 elongation factor P [Alphaproteobacteria bacterium]